METSPAIDTGFPRLVVMIGIALEPVVADRRVRRLERRRGRLCSDRHTFRGCLGRTARCRVPRPFP